MSKLLYSKLADYYDYIIQPFTDTKKEIGFLNKLFKKNNVKKVLDIACGTGRHCIELAKLGYEATGIDISKDMIRVARNKAEKQKLKIDFIRKDVGAITFAGEFDAAICMWGTFYYLPWPVTLKRVSRALKPGGIFVLNGRDWDNIDKSPKAYPELKTVVGGVVVKQKMSERFVGNKRVKRIEYMVGNKKFVDNDTCTMRPLEKIKRMLIRNKMKPYEMFLDFNPRRKGGKAYRCQIVSRKVA